VVSIGGGEQVVEWVSDHTSADVTRLHTLSNSPNTPPQRASALTLRHDPPQQQWVPGQHQGGEDPGHVARHVQAARHHRQHAGVAAPPVQDDLGEAAAQRHREDGGGLERSQHGPRARGGEQPRGEEAQRPKQQRRHPARCVAEVQDEGDEDHVLHPARGHLTKSVERVALRGRGGSR